MINKDQLKEKFHSCKEWVLNHSKIVLPAVVGVCVAITVVVALSANKKEMEKQVVAAVETEESSTEVAIPEEPFEVNAYPEINNIMQSYYTALANGDVATIETLNSYVSEKEKIHIAEISKYIESYPQIDVYTKKGPVENSFLVYAYSHVKFSDYENTVPGMQTFYVCRKGDGSYYINEGEEDEAVLDYIRNITLQDDVIDLNNKVAVEYNDLCASDEALSAFLVELDSQIKISVGEILAASEAESEQAAGETAEEGTEAAGEETAENVIQTARTTDVVNIRSSDSQTADKLGKAQKGDTFTVLETKVNGWSRIEYEGQEAYIRSDYLEIISTETVSNEGDEEENEASENEAEENVQEEADDSSNGEKEYVTVKETVNVRAGQSQESDKVGVAYQGDRLELIMELADGWCKIKYNGETAYVKSEFVE
ncbi:MAG: SH3 domain-containing protein [Lachnospiraceae bacterium]|nr:SH3 domain-containing protein [Lachnospiraceae bacterium]